MNKWECECKRMHICVHNIERQKDKYEYECEQNRWMSTRMNVNVSRNEYNKSEFFCEHECRKICKWMDAQIKR